MIIQKFTNAGIFINGGTGNNSVLDNYIGTDRQGQQSDTLGNRKFGILINNSPDNSIGFGVSTGNNIACTDSQTVESVGISIKGPQSTGNSIQGNLIGVDRTGNRPSAFSVGKTGVISVSRSGTIGIQISDGATQTSIGAPMVLGDTGNMILGDGNVIANWGVADITIAKSSTDSGTNNTISGNIIGMFSNGKATFQIGDKSAGVVAGLNGIVIEANSSRNLIGAAYSAPQGGGLPAVDPLNGNVIGNASGDDKKARGNGILLAGSQNQVQFNLIGTDLSGKTAVPDKVGIRVTGADNRISQNVISGNTVAGIQIVGKGATNNLIGRYMAGGVTQLAGNVVGLGVDGETAVPNGIGIQTDAVPAVNVIIGNYIAGNKSDGVRIQNSVGQEVMLNFIGVGLGSEGQAAVGNRGNGVLVDGGSGNWIGFANLENIISANWQNGILIQNSSGNKIQANTIGLSPAGEAVAEGSVWNV